MQSPKPIKGPFEIPSTIEECITEARALSREIAAEVVQVDSALVSIAPGKQSSPNLPLGVRVPLELAHEDLTRLTRLLRDLKHDVTNEPPLGAKPVPPEHRPERMSAVQSAVGNIEQCSLGLKRFSTSFKDPFPIAKAGGSLERIYKQLRLLSMMLEKLEEMLNGGPPNDFPVVSLVWPLY